MSLVELCKYGDLEKVKAALQSGIDVNTKDEYGMTGLMRAVRNSHNSVVELLLKTPNIDVSMKDEMGDSALHIAVEVNNMEGLKMLLDVPSIDVNTRDKHGWTGLIGAVWKNHNSVVELLLKTPNIDVNMKDESGNSALHWAVDVNNMEGLKVLLAVPCIDVNTRNDKGETGLMLAVSNNCNSMVELLLKTPNIDVNMKNNKDESAVMLAVMFAYKLECLPLLVADLRVDIDTTDMYGRSLEERARISFSPETLSVLEKAKQRREEKRRLIKAQQRQVSKVLLEGLYDSDSPISKLLGVHKEVLGEIIWQKMLANSNYNWQIFPDPANPAWL